eukprot:s326_g25.t1
MQTKDLLFLQREQKTRDCLKHSASMPGACATEYLSRVDRASYRFAAQKYAARPSTIYLSHKIMARSSSVAAPLLFIAAAAYALSCCRSAPSFVAPPKAAEAALQQQQQAAVVSATLAAASMPAPAWAARASDEDDEGFDVRIIAVLALPLFAISWALFNVWRVAFRQVVRQGENAKGNAL